MRFTDYSRRLSFLFCFLAFSMGLRAASARKLELHPDRLAPTDLALVGQVNGIGRGETRFVRWTDLAALPSTKLRLTGEFVPGEQEVTIVYLTDLWQALPRASGADTLLATCSDGYASVYREAFMVDYRPFLILAINGQGPEKWPPPGLSFNPAPYVISVAASVAPAVAQLIDAGHKRPWGVTTIEVASYEPRFAGVLKGKWAQLSPRAVEGRELWVHSCASCHVGPAGTFGGTKSDRPFEVLAAHAARNRDYFKGYVRDPKGFVAIAKMEAHPHYTEAQLDALIAFITAEAKP